MLLLPSPAPEASLLLLLLLVLLFLLLLLLIVAAAPPALLLPLPSPALCCCLAPLSFLHTCLCPAFQYAVLHSALHSHTALQLLQTVLLPLTNSRSDSCAQLLQPELAQHCAAPSADTSCVHTPVASCSSCCAAAAGKMARASKTMPGRASCCLQLVLWVDRVPYILFNLSPRRTNVSASSC
jgi:hypothetical protein